ncbi:class I adenylate-forming enzyme family protein [Kitasatospora sp. NPDC052896]|uniref:class I adenylate-forming enzyme family protein n=1 Tax=Kitasatospora sp. NPDC052896 TaxID=3364061 RepID=UPI0037C8B29C
MTAPISTTVRAPRSGLDLPDLVPAELRRQWSAQGHYPDRGIADLFAERVRGHPRRPAVVCPGETLDYAELDRRTGRIATALRSAGVAPGDVVAIRLPNGWPAVATELAAAAVGATALTFPAGRGLADTRALLRRSRAVALLSTAATAHEIGPELARLPFLRAVFAIDGTGSTVRTDPGPDRPGPTAHEDPPDTVPVDPSAAARILVSSGSESEPKMVAYSHNAMAGGRGNYLRAVYRGTEVPRALVLVPLSSSYGSLGVITLYRHGGTLLLLDGFDAATALRAITAHRPTHLFGVATMLRRMTQLAPESGEDLSSLRSVIASCDGLPPALLADCLARFGCPVSNLYGSTDGLNCRADHRTSTELTSVLGQPDPAVCEFRIHDEQGRPLPAGEPGEIWARGPMTPLCYVGAPQLDARYRAPGGWVRSGDRGRLTADGRLELVRRNSNVVKRGGYSISPAEVERHAGAHPAVAEAVCLAVPDPDLGERLCVCVVPRQGTAAPTLAELNHFLEQRRGLERRKLPEQLLRLAELPLGAAGKLDRNRLTALARSAPPAR